MLVSADLVGPALGGLGETIGAVGEWDAGRAALAELLLLLLYGCKLDRLFDAEVPGVAPGRSPGAIVASVCCVEPADGVGSGVVSLLSKSAMCRGGQGEGTKWDVVLFPSDPERETECSGFDDMMRIQGPNGGRSPRHRIDTPHFTIAASRNDLSFATHPRDFDLFVWLDRNQSTLVTHTLTLSIDALLLLFSLLDELGGG